jgi:predicted NBD/HSP70 family sugar kinase
MLSPMTGPGSQRAWRLMNRQRVVDELIRRGAVTQATLARSTGLSPATISNIVRELSDAGTLAVPLSGPTGRRGRYVQLSSKLGVVLGIDVGQRHVRVALGSLDYTILAERDHALPLSHVLEDDLELANDLAESLLRDSGLRRDDVLAVGIGLPAPLDLPNRRLATSPHLPLWGSDVGTIVVDRFGENAQIDNDANLGALGEYVWGAAQGVRNAVYIKMSTSVGAGLIINGEIAHGERGTAGEIGHMTVEENGRACFCGGRGCLVTVVEASALLDQVKHMHGADLTVDQMLELARTGDRACARVLEDAGRRIGVVIGTLCNVLNPAMVVLGGPIIAADGIVLEAARTAARRHALPFTLEQVEFVPAALGVSAEVHGAVALAIRAAAPAVPLAR